MTILAISAEQLIQELQQRHNLYRLSHAGNTFQWFSTDLPADLPKGDRVHQLIVEEIPLPYKNFTPILTSLSAWMSYWSHMGGKIDGATAFVSVSPLRQGKPIAILENLEPFLVPEGQTSNYYYGVEDYMLSYLCRGLVSGLQTVLSHPLADVRIQILQVIAHKVDSSPKAFERLGQWLIEAMITEMYKRNWIDTVQRGND